MNHTHAQERTIGVRDVYRELPRLIKAAEKGISFLVLKHAKPVLRIGPPDEKPKGYRYTFDDIKKIQFRSRYKNLSKDIDKILYGA